MPETMVVWSTRSAAPAETAALGQAIGRTAQPGQVIALHGDLGAGKTTFTQGIAVGVGVTARVTSPTFILVNEYTGRYGLRFVHVDAYRLGGPPAYAAQEAAAFGLDEVLDAAQPVPGEPGAVVVIEWAERVADLLPEDLLDVTFVQAEGEENVRCLEFRAIGAASAELLAALIGVHRQV